MITLGIDPGTLFTGYGVIESSGKTFRAVDFGVIVTDPKADMPTRLKSIYDTLQSIITTHKPLKVALETAFFGKNMQSALKLGQVRGAIMILAMNNRLSFSEYAPREIKKSITGNGNAAKEQVEFMAKKLLGLGDRAVRADAYDALAIALCDSFFAPQVGVGESIKRSGKAKDWKSFVEANPHLVVK